MVYIYKILYVLAAMFFSLLAFISVAIMFPFALIYFLVKVAAHNAFITQKLVVFDRFDSFMLKSSRRLIWAADNIVEWCRVSARM